MIENLDISWTLLGCHENERKVNEEKKKEKYCKFSCFVELIKLQRKWLGDG